MSYKTILVHVDHSPQANSRIALAASLAVGHGAHLVGAATTGVSQFVFSGSNIDIARTVIDSQLQLLINNANAALAQFERIAGGVAGLSFERQLVDDDEGPGLTLLARYADLVVVSQSDPDPPLTRIAPDLPAYLMLHTAGPLLVVPFAGAPAACGSHALVAWDESVQASRALAQSLPLLRRAQTVSLVMFYKGREAPRACAAIVAYLGRHGVNASVRSEHTETDVGYALLALASDVGADVIVMGGYGHARMREVLLGGVTQTVLSSMTIPVLMSH